jgi:hypothetical protein
VTSIIMMPDTDPVIDDVALVDFVQRLARDEAVVNVYPAAALTKGLKRRGNDRVRAAARGRCGVLCNGRHTVDNPAVMRRAMTYARDFGAVVAMATQDRHLGGAGVMNEGLFASWLGLPGIPREAEIIPLERDLRLAALTRSRYHAMSISVPESAEIIRAAKARGLNVTAGISINHLTLNETDIGEYRTFFRLSPPLRTEDDRRAMVSALAKTAISTSSSRRTIRRTSTPNGCPSRTPRTAPSDLKRCWLRRSVFIIPAMFRSCGLWMPCRPARPRYSVLMPERSSRRACRYRPVRPRVSVGAVQGRHRLQVEELGLSRMPGLAAKYCKHWLQVSQFIAPECDR